MFFQGVCFKAMWRCVKIVTSNSTDETLGLEGGDRTAQIKQLCLLTEGGLKNGKENYSHILTRIIILPPCPP